MLTGSDNLASFSHEVLTEHVHVAFDPSDAFGKRQFELGNAFGKRDFDLRDAVRDFRGFRGRRHSAVSRCPRVFRRDPGGWSGIG